MTIKQVIMHQVHGRRSRGGQGGQVPPEFGAGDANANCPPPQILSYRYKNERSAAFKIRPNPFLESPGPRWGSSRRSPRPLSRLERGHPSPYLAPLGTDPPSALAMRPPISPARATPMTKSVVERCRLLRVQSTTESHVCELCTYHSLHVTRDYWR